MFSKLVFNVANYTKVSGPLGEDPINYSLFVYLYTGKYHVLFLIPQTLDLKVPTPKLR